MRELPTLAVLGVVAGGLVVGALLDWRTGASVIGLALLLGAALRLTLSPRRAGLLVVRTRPFDATVLLVLGFAVVGLALAVPTS